MNGYQLVKAFYAECEINEPMQIGCTGNHFSLYNWICELRNRVQATQPTREILDLPVRYTMQMSFIGSDNTLKKCLDNLESWGIIEIIQRGTNQHTPTKVRIAVAYLLRHNCDSDAIALRLQSDSSAIALRTTKTDKTIKTDKTNMLTQFELFWNAYDNKVDRKKCLAKWEKLKPEEHTAILENVPLYVQTTRHKDHPKNPLTYLNGNCWEDPINPSSRPAQKQTVY